VSSPSEDNTPEQPEVEMDGFKVVRAAKTEKAGDLFPERKGDYHFPTLELLMEPPEEEANEDEDHMIKARNLKETLAQFKVEIELGEVHTGPVITRYDVHPAAGVRVEKIANLDKNLAMALKADSVRILAPVPGKGCVGIEVPNQKPAPVCLKEILQSKAWADAGAEIPIVLGKEASGRALVADLTKMPHLLVAGSTGSGKTVCINAIIASLCYHSSPEDVRFIMVDPKIVEMKVYNDLPHMLIPVVTEPKKVPGALKWLLVEMERRYQIFSKVGVRNIAGFNAKILKDKEEKEKAQLLDAQMTAEERAALSSIEVPRDDDVLEIPENKLPYIVCIIDELADLMMVAQADVETGIARLAQLARAAGIHLIIATQRPSVNVITGVIKANLPSRISFRVASYRDSQTILDGKGAEALIGKGDMLFIPPGSSTFLRAQGAFVSDEEINGIVDYLKVNGPPQIIEEVREQIESAGEDDVLGDGDDSDEDPMVRKAIEVIRSTKRASTSNLQRKLSIGYNRAARIMDDLEDRGLIGPDVPGQGREILMDL
jgi:S-DNA-T family DNA segregation ATPase FtsK/SpoIIIE